MKIIRISYVILFVFYCAVFPETILRVKAIGKALVTVTPPAKARILAFRAAKIEAYKKLARAVGVSREFHENGQDSVLVEAFLTGAHVVDKKYISDYEVEVTMEMPKEQLIQQLTQFSKKDIQLSKLNKEIAVVESQILELNDKLQKLKEIKKKLEEGQK